MTAMKMMKMLQGGDDDNDDSPMPTTTKMKVMANMQAKRLAKRLATMRRKEKINVAN